MNGPFPEGGAIENMTGDGGGFLYTMGETVQSNDVVLIGPGYAGPNLGRSAEGSDRASSQASITPSDRDLQVRARTYIEAQIQSDTFELIEEH